MKESKIREFFKAKGLRVKLNHYHLPKIGGGSPFETAVSIYNSDGDLVASGASYCSPHDNPVKAIGRAKALGRAYADYLRKQL